MEDLILVSQILTLGSAAFFFIFGLVGILEAPDEKVRLCLVIFFASVIVLLAVAPVIY